MYIQEEAIPNSSERGNNGENPRKKNKGQHVLSMLEVRSWGRSRRGNQSWEGLQGNTETWKPREQRASQGLEDKTVKCRRKVKAKMGGDTAGLAGRASLSPHGERLHGKDEVRSQTARSRTVKRRRRESHRCGHTLRGLQPRGRVRRACGKQSRERDAFSPALLFFFLGIWGEESISVHQLREMNLQK